MRNGSVGAWEMRYDKDDITNFVCLYVSEADTLPLSRKMNPPISVFHLSYLYNFRLPCLPCLPFSLVIIILVQ